MLPDLVGFVASFATGANADTTRCPMGGHLEGELASPLVPEALEGLEAEKQSFEHAELSSEEANRT